jgi:hypothetical protein
VGRAEEVPVRGGDRAWETDRAGKESGRWCIRDWVSNVKYCCESVFV